MKDEEVTPSSTAVPGRLDSLKATLEAR